MVWLTRSAACFSLCTLDESKEAEKNYKHSTYAEV